MLLFALGCAGPSRNPKASGELAQLGKDYWEFLMRENPLWATYLGDFRYNDKLSDLSEDHRREIIQTLKAFQNRLLRIDPEPLSEEEHISWEILRQKLELTIEEDRHKFHQWAVDQMDGPQVSFPQLMNYHPLKMEKDYEDLAVRMESFPRHLQQYQDNLHSGLVEGRTAPRIAVDRVLDQLKKFDGMSFEDSPFAASVRKFPETFSKSVRQALETRLRQAYETGFRGALRNFHAFLEKDYQAHARQSVGLWALPGGAEAYRSRIRLHTSLDKSPEELHKTGLDELHSLQEQMMTIARKLGYSGTLATFFDSLRSQKDLFFKNREEMMESARSILKKLDTRLPKLFKRLPKTGYEVKPIEDYREKDAPAAYYYQPPDDGSRSGIYYVNTYLPETRPRYNFTALSAHEAVPGHHLQIAFAVELRDLPPFRRHGDFTAYIEGWGLYAELLADELNMYPDDYSRFGMLNYQAWRAARLVVDTGLHAMKWTREQAIDFFRQNVAIAGPEVTNEIDRYIIWPGQALAYMVGRMEYQRLRELAHQALGDRFDVREYHDEVLRHGAVPLSTLRLIVQSWIQQSQ